MQCLIHLLIGKGATALCKTPNVPEEEYQYVKSVFSLCGITADVEEKDINAVIAVSGSSPAYIYLFAKAVADYAKSVGFNREVAKLLFAQALVGSAGMITEASLDEDNLIEMVSSKGGTTIVATTSLKAGGFEDIIKEAMSACIKRAEELAQNK